MNKEPVPLGPRPVSVGVAPLTRQRLAVLDYVRDHAPVRISAAAAGLGLHANTVREHLEALVEAGLVDGAASRPTGRGRPATVYRPTAADPAAPAHEYAALATALAGHLARTSADPGADARAAGIEWGRELVGDQLHGDESATDDPGTRVLEILARLGFGPDTSDPSRGIALRSCPLLDAARRHPEIVCQVHLGIIDGVLEQLGAITGPGLDLIPFAEPGACRLFLPDPTMPGEPRP